MQLRAIGKGVMPVTAFFELQLHSGPHKETAMHQFRKNAVRTRRAAVIAVVFGSIAWLGLLIGAEAVQPPAAWHLADASSPARHP